MLDIRLRTFLEVCRCLNITRAAENLHMTQPAVSQHIKFLERKYGMKLFFREGRSIRLTPAGEVLRTAATSMEHDEQIVLARMAQAEDSHRSLCFGVTLTIGEYIVPSLLTRYLRRHPETDIQIHYANTTELLRQMNEGEIDFALIEGYFDPASYASLLFRTERYLPVCAAGHRFAGERVVRLRDLLGERLLTREPGSGSREILERNLAVQGIGIEDFAHRVQVESVHTIVRLLVEDCGIAFLYQASVSQELRQGILKEIPLEDVRMVHDFSFIWDINSVFSDDLRAICRELAGSGGLSRAGETGQ